jgi:hypothetical protein
MQDFSGEKSRRQMGADHAIADVSAGEHEGDRPRSASVKALILVVRRRASGRWPDFSSPIAATGRAMRLHTAEESMRTSGGGPPACASP